MPIRELKNLEMNAVVEELRTVLAYRAKELKLDVPASSLNNFNPAISCQTSGAHPMDIEDSAGATSSTRDQSPSKSQRKGNKRRKLTNERVISIQTWGLYQTMETAPEVQGSLSQ